MQEGKSMQTKSCMFLKPSAIRYAFKINIYIFSITMAWIPLNLKSLFLENNPKIIQSYVGATYLRKLEKCEMRKIISVEQHSTNRRSEGMDF